MDASSFLQKNIEGLYAKRTKGFSLNIIREIAKKTTNGDYISFAGGNPSADTFPAEELSQVAVRSLTEKRVESLQYGVTAGYPPLREWIACYLCETKGINVTKDNILITSGSQQGISLLTNVFIDEGDGIVVEDPTYVAALQIFRQQCPALSAVKLDAGGIQLDELEQTLSAGKYKLFYSVPTFQNPTGACMKESTRRQLPSMMDVANAIMVEDDPYGDLYYDEKPPLPVKSYDIYNRIIYMGSFSKIVAPGLRLGYIVGDVKLITRLEALKQSADLSSSNLSQVLLHTYLTSYSLQQHLEKTRNQYREKRDFMYARMREYFPPGTKYNRPGGGLFFWVELPTQHNAYDLLQQAIQRKVTFVPAKSFYSDNNINNTMRISFSNETLERIDQGIKILGELIMKNNIII